MPVSNGIYTPSDAQIEAAKPTIKRESDFSKSMLPKERSPKLKALIGDSPIRYGSRKHVAGSVLDTY